MKGIKTLWQAWKNIAARIAAFQARLLLTLLYFLFTPFALGVKLFSDPLRLRNPTSSADHSFWEDRPLVEPTLEEHKKQF